jgi:hypothetical protein
MRFAKLLAVTALVVVVPACAKSNVCGRLAERNVGAADAVHAHILADYELFAAYTQKQMGRTPPSRVQTAALRSADHWRAFFADEQFERHCVTQTDDAQVTKMADCLERPHDDAYASCMLDALEVPTLGHQLTAD